MMPKPISQNTGVPMQKSIRFFISMLPVFFARVKPASHMEKPACMKKTIAAPSSTQMVFTELKVMSIPSKYYSARTHPQDVPVPSEKGVPGTCCVVGRPCPSVCL